MAVTVLREPTATEQFSNVAQTRCGALFQKIVTGGLATPDTWDVALSGGADKRETFERLIDGKLGALALLRNLRNMIQAGVPDATIRAGIEKMKVERVLPFRFISAAKYAPSFEPELEQAMFRCLDGSEKLPGTTALVIDTSPISNSKVRR